LEAHALPRTLQVTRLNLPSLALALWLSCALSLPAQQGAAAAAHEGLQAGPWQLLGPFPNPDGNAPSEHAVQGRLKDMRLGKPWSALEERFTSGAKMISWKEVHGTNPRGQDPLDSGSFSFNQLFDQSTSTKQAAYLYCPLDAAQAMDVDVLFGSDDGCVLWLNGKELLRRPFSRKNNPYEEQVRLPLEQGRNHLLLEVSSANGWWGCEMQAARGTSQLDINRAVDRGVAYLLRRQLIDGSWEETQFQYRNGGTALVLYTLLSSGVDPHHPAILRGLEYLRTAPSSHTYSAGCELMMLASLEDPAVLPWIEERADDLISWQLNNGGWAYPEGHWDMSCTQFAALGLRAAAESGAEIPKKVWVSMVDLCLDSQERPDRKRLPLRAGFAYYPGARAATGSMTAAGIAVLAIAREQLGDDLKRTEVPRVEEALQLSTQVLEEDFTTAVNPGFDLNWRYYWLYGVERVSALLGRPTLGHHDWYREGAAFLVNDQGADGQWSTPWGRNEATTCFALLFLKKATAQAVATGVSATRSEHYQSEGTADPAVLHVNARAPATMWMESKKDAHGVKRKLIAARYSTRRPGSTDWIEIGMGEGGRLALQHAFPGPGFWEVRAEVFASPPPNASGPGAGGDPSAVKPTASPVSLGFTAIVLCDYQVGIREEDLRYASDSTRNELPRSRPEILISSQLGGRGGEALIDGKPWSGWQCAANDATPTIDIKCKRRPRASHLLLTQMRTRQSDQANNPRPTQVEIWINKDKVPLLVDLEPDATRKTIIELPKHPKVGTLKIVVTKVSGGTLGALAVGFGEVELQN